MGDNSDIIITYGLGYVFGKNKLIGMLKTKEIVRKIEGFNINEEIEYLNSSQSTVYKNKYIDRIEEALEEKVSDIILLILDIRNRDEQSSNNTILDKYKKNYFIYLRYLKEGYKYKDLSYVQAYLDKCFNKEDADEFIKYDRVTLKLLLTTPFGERLGDFIRSFTSSYKISDGEKIKAEQIKEAFNKSKILQVDYKSIDFMLLVKDLVLHEELECEGNIDYRKVLKLVSKDGKVEEDKYQFKEQIVRFLEEKNYLYFTYAKYSKEDIITTLDNKRYLYKDSYIYRILCKKGSHLFEPTPLIVDVNGINENKELGFLLSYSNEKVEVCAATLDKRINIVSIIQKIPNSYEQILLGIGKYIEI